eukprot:NODE_6866_length_485_cov_55.490826_g6071_i0.p1 GENE.NODE_6866_length_485_cov_55.490826_g6071_i0~~NODE_6866_length_485_cov_55.490826_g6071_i0.p1  ORF type:complete len:103 (+),score=11.63 NODE_6866_length_485_cov_55.490826_g6071_i0:152-460(+)
MEECNFGKVLGAAQVCDFPMSARFLQGPEYQVNFGGGHTVDTVDSSCFGSCRAGWDKEGDSVDMVKKADFLKATKSLSNPAIEAIIYSGHQKDWVSIKRNDD